MSQNKTVIQGLEPETNVSASSGAGSNFYARGNSRSSAARGTVVPGMTNAQMESNNVSSEIINPQPRKAVQPGKPIVGFLYSISRTPMGEYWPLQMGRNTIGQAADSDILLTEGTVSTNHAIIVTRQVKNGIIAAITDSQSTNGTMINGEPIGFSAEECHDGDIITIGNNYQFVMILIDAAKRGLSVSKDFISVNTETEEDEEDNIPSFSPGSTRPGGFNPYNDGPTAWGGTSDGGFSPAGGTVGLDGSMSGGNHGGTVPM
ncbi:MAG: FHA domain-containing protein [Prevotella sp.]|nr:FHA domain-containing protein [Prevotella sp.]